MDGDDLPADDPGPLLATGRAADVFDLGDGTVLRRYRAGTKRTDYETRVMRHVADHGVSVPKVFDLAPEHLPERDIVMEKIEGVTMLDDLQRRPWKVRGHARLLARLQAQVAAVEAPDWMQSPGWAKLPERSSGRTDSVLHLDLHPMNVMLAPDGPVIIDWTNSTAGPAGFDAAITYTLMACFETDNPRDRFGQRVLVSSFRKASGPRVVDAFLVAACSHRLADPGVTPGERVNVAALRKRMLNRTG